MNKEQAIAKLKNFADHCYPNEEFLIAIKAIEQVGCLTDRPCDVCRFKTENGCNRWECVFKGV